MVEGDWASSQNKVTVGSLKFTEHFVLKQCMKSHWFAARRAKHHAWWCILPQNEIAPGLNFNTLLTGMSLGWLLMYLGFSCLNTSLQYMLFSLPLNCQQYIQQCTTKYQIGWVIKCFRILFISVIYTYLNLSLQIPTCTYTASSNLLPPPPSGKLQHVNEKSFVS